MTYGSSLLSPTAPIHIPCFLASAIAIVFFLASSINNAPCNRIADQSLRQLELVEGLVEVDDVDAVALREDETAHLRVRAAGLVREMDSRFEQFLDLRQSHLRNVSVCLVRRPLRSSGAGI